MNARARGVTLLELLVALAALAVLALAGYRALSGLLDSETHLDAHARRWNDIARLFAQLDRDLSLAARRGARDAAGAPGPALLAGSGTLVLTRFGEGGESGWHAQPRRVGYRLREGAVEYLVWPAVDLAPGADPQPYRILDGVAELRVQAIDDRGLRSPGWPIGGAAVLPRGVQIDLVLAGGERIRRIVALP